MQSKKHGVGKWKVWCEGGPQSGRREPGGKRRGAARCAPVGGLECGAGGLRVASAWSGGQGGRVRAPSDSTHTGRWRRAYCSEPTPASCRRAQASTAALVWLLT